MEPFTWKWETFVGGRSPYRTRRVCERDGLAVASEARELARDILSWWDRCWPTVAKPDLDELVACIVVDIEAARADDPVPTARGRLTPFVPEPSELAEPAGERSGDLVVAPRQFIAGQRLVVLDESGSVMDYLQVGDAIGLDEAVTVRVWWAGDQRVAAVWRDGQWWEGKIEFGVAHDAAMAAWQAVEAAGFDETALLP